MKAIKKPIPPTPTPSSIPAAPAPFTSTASSLLKVARPARRERFAVKVRKAAGQRLALAVEPGRSETVPLERIIQSVCGLFGASKQDLLGPLKQRHLVMARRVIVFVARRRTAKSFSELAESIRGDLRRNSTVHDMEQALQRQLDGFDPWANIDEAETVEVLLEHYGLIKPSAQRPS